MPKDYLSEQMIVGPYPISINYLTLIANIHGLLMRGETEQARAVAALSMCAGEQAALDSGNWTLAWLLTLQTEPQYAKIGARKMQNESLQPYARCLNDQWVAAHLSYLRDADLVLERRKKYQHRVREDAAEAGGKGQKGRKGQKGEGKGTSSQG